MVLDQHAPLSRYSQVIAGIAFTIFVPLFYAHTNPMMSARATLAWQIELALMASSAWHLARAGGLQS